MKLEITKEWCLAAARREGNVEVGAGRLAFDPKPEVEGTTNPTISEHRPPLPRWLWNALCKWFGIS